MVCDRMLKISGKPKICDRRIGVRLAGPLAVARIVALRLPVITLIIRARVGMRWWRAVCSGVSLGSFGDVIAARVANSCDRATTSKGVA